MHHGWRGTPIVPCALVTIPDRLGHATLYKAGPVVHKYNSRSQTQIPLRSAQPTSQRLRATTMGKLPFTTFIGNQWTRLEPVLTADLTGKTVVVVGANTGIGFEAAQHFARMGPKRLILACRNEQRGQDAAARKGIFCLHR